MLPQLVDRLVRPYSTTHHFVMALLLSLGHIHEQTVHKALSDFLGIVATAALGQLGVLAQRTQLPSYVQCGSHIASVYEVLLDPALEGDWRD